ncbi:hypothetical protein [Azospirillum sp. TSH64]|uniref:hypothetical protein n=1 Tax=Azospirillum sp. TSH64 TaxID=652740 RepID=UPI000D605446|nr:hypothetical protein [Azospirillum sp. TSH64]PWC81267.1 hypothetical protein TSH64_01090 [Azospirillum sp. TSH64]
MDRLARILAALRQTGLGYNLSAMKPADLELCLEACRAEAEPDDDLRGALADLEREGYRRWAWEVVLEFARRAGMRTEEARADLRQNREAIEEAYRAGMSPEDAVALYLDLFPRNPQ